MEEDRWAIFAKIQRELGPRDVVEAIVEELGLEVTHVSPEKTGTVSNIEERSEQPSWLSLQSPRYFLRRSVSGKPETPGRAACQGRGVAAEWG